MEAINDGGGGGEEGGVAEGEEDLIVVDSRMFGVLWIGSHVVAVINPNPPAGGELWKHLGICKKAFDQHQNYNLHQY